MLIMKEQGNFNWPPICTKTVESWNFVLLKVNCLIISFDFSFFSNWVVPILGYLVEEGQKLRVTSQKICYLGLMTNTNFWFWMHIFAVLKLTAAILFYLCLETKGLLP